MKIAHIGPPLARSGGPAGYLYQLQRAAHSRVSDSLQVLFPPPASPAALWPGPTRVQRARHLLGRWKRQLLGPPQSAASLGSNPAERRGGIDRMLKSVVHACVEEATPSLSPALAENGADILFVHDIFCADFLIRQRNLTSGYGLWRITPCPWLST